MVEQLDNGTCQSPAVRRRNKNPGIPNHYETRFDELIVDLHSIGRVDLVVVDAIVGMERGRVQAWGGHPRRLNTVIAGRDAVAVDAVCTRLVGFNPDDFEFLTLAGRLGLADALRLRAEGLLACLVAL